MARQVYEKDRLYSTLKHKVDFAVRRLAYRRYQVVGKEKLPTDGAIIYAPNHANCLMDALIILTLNRPPKVFLARADIFKKPKIRSALEFCKMMPINRVRDGRMSVLENDETFDVSVASLLYGTALCLMPEGRHRPKHSLLPLGKGLVRIALEAFRQNPSRKLYVVPIGLEYSDYFHYYGDVLVTHGRPIEIGEFVASIGGKVPLEGTFRHSEGGTTEESHDTPFGIPTPVIMSKFNDLLASRMKETILYIPVDEWYDATEFLLAVNLRYKGCDLARRLEENRAAAAHIASLRADDPTFEETMLPQADKAAKLCISKKIALSSVSHPGHFGWHVFGVVLSVVFSPYILACGVLSAPVWALSELIGKKIRDRAFMNSFRFFFHLVLWPFLLIVYGVLAFVFAPWEWALAGLLLAAPAMQVVHSVGRCWRLFVSDIRYRKAFKNIDLQRYRF